MRISRFFEVLVICVRGFRDFGVRFALDELTNQLNSWTWSNAQGLESEAGETSLSDGSEYVMVCKDAVLHPDTFSRYKSSKQYQVILEHTSYSLGLNYLEISKQNQHVLKTLKAVIQKENGKPFVYTYPEIGKASPTQIRYAKVSLDLIQAFGSLNGLKIGEIGVGFGGQALHLLTSFEDCNYEIYDLFWPSKLALKNILSFDKGLEKRVRISTLAEGTKCDLVISNYAFSELNRAVQEEYLANVILNSPRGYVIFNHIQVPGSESLTAIEFANRITGAELFQEVPKTHPENVLVMWGHHKEILESDYFIRI
jgi:hypothetical protein